jgi:hypothetical protein
VPTADVRQRLVVLHRLLEHELDRNANENAVMILKEIAAETKGVALEPIPKAPSADPHVRLTYWHELYDRARRYAKVETTIDMLREIRKEAALCK